MIEDYDNSSGESEKIEQWCREIDPCGETSFYERVKSTGITKSPNKHSFHVYLRRRLPNWPLQHVKKWDNYLPGIDEIGCTLGKGEAVIDFQVLYGRYTRKKKCSKRVVIRFGEAYEEKKRKKEAENYNNEVKRLNKLFYG
jgi:hypothetical protein